MLFQMTINNISGKCKLNIMYSCNWQNQLVKKLFRHFLDEFTLPNEIISFDLLLTLWTNRFKILYIQLLPICLIRSNFHNERYFGHTYSQHLSENNNVNSREQLLIILSNNINILFKPSQADGSDSENDFCGFLFQPFQHIIFPSLLLSWSLYN